MTDVSETVTFAGGSVSGDIDGDGTVGLEEAVHALKVTSGKQSVC